MKCITNCNFNNDEHLELVNAEEHVAVFRPEKERKK